MKKVLTFFTLLFFAMTLFAQDTNTKHEMKNFRFGGTVTPSLDWYRPDDLKKFSYNGSVLRFGVLLNGEYSFSGNFALGFGIGINSGGGKITFSDTAHYYFSDGGIIKVSDTVTGKYEHYKLNNRTYTASYFVLPISIKMRTNEIGYIRYFFEPRVNINLRKKVRTDDDLITMPKTGTGQTTNQSKLDMTKDMSFLRVSTTLSIGGEYYVSGSTALVFSIGYDYGLTNSVRKNSEYLLRAQKSGGEYKTPVEQKFTQQGMVLTFGLLF